jgi:hypothetical protein
MPRWGFETTISVFERMKTFHAQTEGLLWSALKLYNVNGVVGGMRIGRCYVLKAGQNGKILER